VAIMLIVSTCLWDANDASHAFSRCYDESWANKLFAGFRRNLNRDFRFVVYTDRKRRFAKGIEQRRLSMKEPHYGACIEPFASDEAQIFCGLDTVIVGNCDHLADYCLTADKPAVPKDPFYPELTTNSVVLAPKGCRAMLFDGWSGQNDMDWIRSRDCALTDTLFPRQIASYKGRVQWVGIEDETRIVFFHGVRKPHELDRIDFIKEHWREDAPVNEAAA
jgi:hypothetical protein